MYKTHALYTKNTITYTHNANFTGGGYTYIKHYKNKIHTYRKYILHTKYT